MAVYEAVENGEDFVLKDLNRAAEEIERVKREDIVGRRVSEVFPGIKEFGIFAVFQRVWKTGEPEYFPENIYRDTRIPGTWRENWVYRLPAGEIVSVYNDITARKQTEEQLAHSEEKYRILFENAIEAIAVAQDGRLKFINPRITELIGYTKDEILSKPFIEFIHPDDRGFVVDRHLRRMGGDRIDEVYPFRFVDKTGITRWVEISAVRIEWEGRPATLNFFSEITARKQAEDALRESEERLRLKLDRLLVADYIVEEEELKNIIDSAEIQSMMNDFYALTKIGIAILDMKGNILVATGWQDICTKFHRVNEESCKNCVESDLYLAQNVKPGEYRFYKCKNNMWDVVTPIIIGEKHVGNLYLGQFFFDDEVIDRDIFAAQAEKFGFDQKEYLAMLERVPRWSRERVNNAMTFYSKFAQMVSSLSSSNLSLARSLSSYKQAEETIRKHREEYRIIFDSVPIIITYIDKDGRFIRINRVGAAALGSTPKEVVGKTFYDFFPPDEAVKFISRSKEVIESKVPIRGSISRATLPSGKNIWTQTDIIPYLDDNGNSLGSINVVEVITERKIAEEAHRESEERFRNMTNLLPQTVFETDEKANFTFVNSQGYETFGYSEEDIARGINVLNTIISEDRDRAIENIDRRIKDENFLPQEYTAVRKDETRFPAVIYANPIIRDSKYAGMRGILIDITDRKQLELNLEKSVADLNKTLHDIVSTMSTIVELKDPYTAGHQKRVARLAAVIAEEIGLPDEKVDYIRTAALIHDIGKLYVPSDIMSKPGKLSDLEHKIIRTHAESSYDILKSIDFPWPIAKIAWQHHERLDGSGYPNGLKEDEILLEAKILSVADVVEAMASHRPYRPALGIDEALAEISENRDKLYDPVVVDACVKLFKEKRFTLE